jgi:hypothetical protein
MMAMTVWKFLLVFVVTVTLGQQSSVLAQSPTATILYPTNGAVNADLSQPIQWTSVANVQAYYLYIGTTLGAKDLVDTGEIRQTSYLAAQLPVGQTIYARMWTKVGGVWRYTDSSFSVSPLPAAFLYPLNGARNVDTSHAFSWTTVPGARAYYLYVGTSPGAKDVIDTGEMTQSSIVLYWNLPTDRPLYARIYTKMSDGTWRFNEISFTAAQVVPSFTSPVDGALNFDPSGPITWTATGADAYRLTVGTSPGGNDVVNTGEASTTSYNAPNLPRNTPLYARIWARHANVWRYQDAVFAVASHPVPEMIAPLNGDTAFDGGLPFQWKPLALARGYRLEIGTHLGANDVHDSGELSITRRFVPDLPVGVPLFGKLSARLGGIWQSVQFTFRVAQSTRSIDAEIDSALLMTDVVRHLANENHLAFTWTSLWHRLIHYNKLYAFCLDYAKILVAMLQNELNVNSDVRDLIIAFNTNGQDTHALVEMHDSRSDRWIVLDPTFVLAPTRARDGALATADEISAAVIAQSWVDISFRFLGTEGESAAQAYYIDYPLLYLNVFHGGIGYQSGQGRSPLPYLEAVSLPLLSQRSVYVVACPQGQSVDAIIDGVERVVACNGVAGLSMTFYATSISIPNTGGVQVYRVRRYIF